MHVEAGHTRVYDSGMTCLGRAEHAIRGLEEAWHDGGFVRLGKCNKNTASSGVPATVPVQMARQGQLRQACNKRRHPTSCFAIIGYGRQRSTFIRHGWHDDVVRIQWRGIDCIESVCECGRLQWPHRAVRVYSVWHLAIKEKHHVANPTASAFTIGSPYGSQGLKRNKAR
jgi:hypothetical protein